jgi:hypothetical protein
MATSSSSVIQRTAAGSAWASADSIPRGLASPAAVAAARPGSMSAETAESST